jgi:hypothetical protein
MSSELSNAAQAIRVEAQERLAQLAQKAKEAHAAAQSCAATAVERALEAGQALLEAKTLCKYGTWTPWLKETFQHEVGTAQSYLRAAKRWNVLAVKCPNATQLPLREVIKLLSNVVPQAADEPAIAQTSEAPIQRQRESDTASGPLGVVATSSLDDVEAVQTVVDLYRRLIEALRHVLELGRRDPTYFQLLLNTLERARPQIEDFEESIRFSLRRRRGA